MSTPYTPITRFRPSLSFLLLAIFLTILWLAGGASRADAAGQALVRGVAWAAIAIAALFVGRRPIAHARAPWVLLGAAVGLALVQLIPLPPGIWQAFPGRDVFVLPAAEQATAPWRPWTIAPSATINAVSSLVVPVATLVLVTRLPVAERRWLAAALLVAVAASLLVGLLQFSGAGFGNPFVNYNLGDVSGLFANRNHFALFLAFGCLIAPAWAFIDGHSSRWRGGIALAIGALSALTILASGSRAGMMLGGLALVLGLAIVWRNLRRVLRRYPRWAFPAVVAGIAGVVAILVLLSVAAGRAVSIDRLLTADAGQDMRSRALPTLLAMVRELFPLGSGLGGFDPVFRMHEPFALLKPTYFNHAHNDFLEVVIDAGLPGLVLLVAAVAWWAWASVRAWRAGSGPEHMLPKAGSAMLLLVMLASIVDYPARTPMIMAMVAIAAAWLSGDRGRPVAYGR